MKNTNKKSRDVLWFHIVRVSSQCSPTPIPSPLHYQYCSLPTLHTFPRFSFPISLYFMRPSFIFYGHSLTMSSMQAVTGTSGSLVACKGLVCLSSHSFLCLPLCLLPTSVACGTGLTMPVLSFRVSVPPQKSTFDHGKEWSSDCSGLVSCVFIGQCGLCMTLY